MRASNGLSRPKGQLDSESDVATDKGKTQRLISRKFGWRLRLIWFWRFRLSHFIALRCGIEYAIGSANLDRSTHRDGEKCGDKAAKFKLS
jgi:hypothetical protein